MPKEEELNVPGLKYRPNRKRWVTRYKIPEEYLPYCKTKDGKQKWEISRFVKKQCSSQQELLKEHYKNLDAIKAELDLLAKTSVQLLVKLENPNLSEKERRKKLRAIQRKKRIQESQRDPLQEELEACATSCTISEQQLREWVLDWFELYFEKANNRLNDLFRYKFALDVGDAVDDMLSDKLDTLWFEFNQLKYGVNVFEPNRSSNTDSLECEELKMILISNRTNPPTSNVVYKKGLRLIRGIMSDIAEWQLDSYKKGHSTAFKSSSLEETRSLAIAPSSLLPEQQSPEKSITVEELFAKFRDRKQKKSQPTQAYWDRFQFVEKLCIETFKQKPVSQITKNQILSLRESISYIPIKKSDPRLADMSLLERSKLSKTENLKRPQNDTANRQLLVAREVFEYAEKENYLERGVSEDLQDYFDDKNRKGHISKIGKRRGFSLGELESIFSHPVFTGCAGSREKRQAKGDKIIWGKEFWGPLIAVFTGMRPREIWQMRVSQIKQEEGITYFDIAEEFEEQSVKTGIKGYRRVPIHPKLIQMGFLEYIKGRPSDDYIIHDVRKSKAQNKTRFFTRYFLTEILPKSQICDSKELTDYYSLRHTFVSRADELGLSEHEIYIICGWSPEDSFGSRKIINTYRHSAYTLERIRNCIHQISYPSINFKPMKLRNLKQVNKHEFEIN